MSAWGGRGCRNFKQKLDVKSNTKINGFKYLVNVIMIKPRRMRWAGHAACMGEKRNAYRLLVGKPEGKKPLRRPRRKWVDTIKMDLGAVEWGDVDWIGLAKDRNRWRSLLNLVLNLRVP
jgi:hypothetical protein